MYQFIMKLTDMDNNLLTEKVLKTNSTHMVKQAIADSKFEYFDNCIFCFNPELNQGCFFDYPNWRFVSIELLKVKPI